MSGTTVYILLIYLIYLQVGAITFYLLEKFYSLQLQTIVAKNEFLSVVNELAEKGIQLKDIKRAAKLINEAYDHSYINDQLEEMQPVWEFNNAFFFTISLVTTIGYGNVTPHTSLGFIVSIVYTGFGVLLNQLVMERIEQNNSKNLQHILSDTRHNTRWQKRWHILAYFFLWTLFVLIVPSLTFAFVERWTLFQSVYYSVITLTTIGFGDYEAGVNLGKGASYIWYKFGFFVWILYGLPFFSMVVSYITYYYLLNGTYAFRLENRKLKLVKLRWTFANQSYHQGIYGAQELNLLSPDHEENYKRCAEPEENDKEKLTDKEDEKLVQEEGKKKLEILKLKKSKLLAQNEKQMSKKHHYRIAIKHK